VVEMDFTTPANMDPIELRRAVRCEVRRLEREATAGFAEEGRPFVGSATVLKQDPFDCPMSYDQRRGLNPTFAGSDWLARMEAAQRNEEWAAAYCAARDAFCAGDRDVVFPAGTWWMVEHFGCNVEAFAAAA
jgi:hypothetical protein